MMEVRESVRRLVFPQLDKSAQAHGWVQSFAMLRGGVLLCHLKGRPIELLAQHWLLFFRERLRKYWLVSDRTSTRNNRP